MRYSSFLSEKPINKVGFSREICVPFYLILFCMFALPGYSTVFKEVTVDEQLKEAEGVIIGHFLKSESVKLESGQIATQMIFKLSKEWGMNSDLFGMDEVIIHYPGGTWEDQTISIEGVPKFIVGERVVVFTKSIENRYWGLNLGLGSYRVINYGNDTMLINSVFPENPKVSQIKLEAFEIKVKKVKGSSLKVVATPLHDSSDESPSVTPSSQGKNRSIASVIEEEDNQVKQSGSTSFWLLVFLGCAGALFRMIKRRKV